MNRILSPQDVARIRGATTDTPAGLRDRAVIALAYGCGMRAGEILAANLADLDFQRSTIRVTTLKQRGRKRERVLPLPQLARADLRDYLVRGRPALLDGRPTDQPALILGAWRGHMRLLTSGPNAGAYSGDDARWTGGALRIRLKACFRRAGVDVQGCGCHALRHAYATHLLQAMLDTQRDALRQVQLLLGHEKLSSTGIYLDVTQEKLEAAVNAAHPWAHAQQLTLHQEEPRARARRRG